jgi:hypothetical protein
MATLHGAPGMDITLNSKYTNESAEDGTAVRRALEHISQMWADGRLEYVHFQQDQEGEAELSEESSPSGRC